MKYIIKSLFSPSFVIGTKTLQFRASVPLIYHAHASGQCECRLQYRMQMQY